MFAILFGALGLGAMKKLIFSFGLNSTVRIQIMRDILKEVVARKCTDLVKILKRCGISLLRHLSI
jgi:predicted transcriptional regulator